jgi:hypothetical protein
MATDRNIDNLADSEDDSETVEVLDLIDHQQHDLPIYGTLLGAFLSFYMTFLEASIAEIGTVSAAGTNVDGFVPAVVLLLVAAGAVAIGRYGTATIASLLVTGIGVLTFLDIQSRVNDLQAGMGSSIFTDAASASVGIGVYILIIASIAGAALAYRQLDAESLSLEE